MFFIEHLHLMYNKPNLLHMNTESSFEEAFVEKKNKMTPGTVSTVERTIQSLIDKLKILFARQTGGGISLETLKHRIRDKISQIKPRLS